MSLISAVWAIGCGGGGENITDPPPLPSGPEFYVSTTGSDDNPGTRALPMATINAAIQAAPATGADVFVSAGTYAEPGSAPLTLRSKVSLHGGYDPTGWTRDPVAFPTIFGTDQLAIASDNADSLSIDGFRVVRASSSDGVLVDLSGSVKVELFDNQFTVAKGEDGGPREFRGEPPAIGRNGLAGDAAGDCNPPREGGTGGSGNPHDGGQGGRGGAAGGFDGGTGAGADGGGGGAGGAIGSDGLPGSRGEHGAAGLNGDGGGSFGHISGSTYVPANGGFGADGSPGAGGGGGGGGGGVFVCGGGGGGGGGGGAGGKALGYGAGGGASIAILVRQDSDVAVHDNVITTGGGGNGGNGPAENERGEGGEGGPGSDGPGLPGGGGAGGRGGSGGPGGDGGGGGGGPSIGILLEEGSTLEQTENTFNIGPAGLGGRGPGNRGEGGEAAEVKELL